MVFGAAMSQLELHYRGSTTALMHLLPRLPYMSSSHFEVLLCVAAPRFWRERQHQLSC